MKPKITVLFEDKNILIVDKPAGLLSYPLPGKSEDTVGSLVGADPVHRLDRDTSGILMLAKNKKAHVALQALFKKRKIEKGYKVLVYGKVEPKKGEINIPLGRGSKDRLRVVPKSSGRNSITLYEVEKYFPKFNVSLCSVDLKTGRTHQIRVHFKAIGHPVVGDKKYSSQKIELNRQFLHSHKIRFIEPFTDKEIKVESKLSKDLSKYLQGLE